MPPKQKAGEGNFSRAAAKAAAAPEKTVNKAGERLGAGN